MLQQTEGIKPGRSEKNHISKDTISRCIDLDRKINPYFEKLKLLKFTKSFKFEVSGEKLISVKIIE